MKGFGPVLLLDAGDALSKELAPSERDKAAFILETMGRLGYAAMAVGERDLVLDVADLQKRAANAKIALLAANVVDKQGKRPFGDQKLINVGGVQVGVFAVTSGGGAFDKQGLKVLPPGPAAQAAANALAKAGAKVVIGLLHLSYDDSLKVAKDLKNVDYVIQAHDGRVSSVQLVGSALMTGAGERGRQIGRAQIEPGKGPLFDLGDAAAAREQLGFLEQTIAQAKEQLKSNPANRAQQEMLIKSYTKRRTELVERAEARPPPGRGSVATEFAGLDMKVTDAPDIKKLVDDFRSKHPEQPGGH